MKAFFSFLFFLCFHLPSNGQPIAGTKRLLTEKVSPGYSLFAPLNSKDTYLIDNCGRVINRWQSQYNPANTCYLSPEGNLVRSIRLPPTKIDGAGGGGGVEILDWEGNVRWTFFCNYDSIRQHHDIELLPNGNILIIAWVRKSRAEAIAAGRKAELIQDDVIWSEDILEIKPIYPSSGEIIWRWSL